MNQQLNKKAQYNQQAKNRYKKHVCDFHIITKHNTTELLISSPSEHIVIHECMLAQFTVEPTNALCSVTVTLTSCNI